MARQRREGCLSEGCPDRHYAHGYCQKHYTQIKKFGRLTPEKEHCMNIALLPDVAEDKPVEVKPRKKLPYMTPVQLAHSNPDVFWAWWGGTSPGGEVGK